jgi:hypothetical protein
MRAFVTSNVQRSFFAHPLRRFPIMKQMDSWDDDWFQPHGRLERAAPLLAIGVALLLAWLQ